MTELDDARLGAIDAASRLEEAAILALVDAAPDGILMADEEGRILFANRQIEELFGFHDYQLVGRSVDDLLPEHLQPRRDRSCG